MKTHFIYIGIIALIIFLAFGSNFEIKWKSPESTKIDSTKVIKIIPEKVGAFSTIEPKPIIVNNYISNNEQLQKIIKDLETKYNQVADSTIILKELLEATKIREYKEVYEDSILVANVSEKVKGTLLNRDFTYKLKPQKVSFYEKTTTETVTPKFSLLVGGKMTTSDQFNNTIFELNAGFQNKKGNIFEIGYDTNSNWSVGVKLIPFRKY